MVSHFCKLVADRDVEAVRASGPALSTVTDGLLRDVAEGDVVWLFEVRGGRAYVIGRMLVGERTGTASHFAIVAQRGTEEPLRDLSLGTAGIQLEFVDPGGSLGGLKGTEDGGQVGRTVSRRGIQSGRRLVPAVAAALDSYWRSAPLEASVTAPDAEPQPADLKGRLHHLPSQQDAERSGHGDSVSEAVHGATGGPVRPAEEVPQGTAFPEGAVERVLVNRYERDERARAACLAHHGVSCCICEFSFATAYGSVGKNLIHVHHLRLLSTLGPNYLVDPIRDLLPVCANCHAIIHRRSPPYSPEEVRKFLQDA